MLRMWHWLWLQMAPGHRMKMWPGTWAWKRRRQWTVEVLTHAIYLKMITWYINTTCSKLGDEELARSRIAPFKINGKILRVQEILDLL